MEDEEQKMTALKKAYAEIILYTAKEAAARVVASERKAQSFQRQLRFTKDVALHLLLRLKHLLDAKTSEAETASLSQHRRIEELEAQLHEAEDIITDLRSELEQAWSELERVNSNHVKPLDEQISKKDASFSENLIPEPIVASPSGSGCETVPTSGMKSIPVNRVIEHKCYNEMKQSEGLSVSDLGKFYTPENLASIIMRSKEPELLRNGCTQRIRAFESNLLDENLLPSGYVNSHDTPGKNEPVIIASDKEEEQCNSPSFSDNSMEVGDNPSVEGTRKPAKVRTLQRRKTRFGKAKTSRQCHPIKLMKSHQPTSVPSHCRTNSDMARTSSGLEESLQHSCCYFLDNIKTFHKGKRTMRRNNKNGITTSLASTGQVSSVLSRCGTFAYTGNVGTKSCEDLPNTTKNEAKMKSLPRLDPGLTLIRTDVDPLSGSTSVTVSKGIHESGAVQKAADKDMELIDVPVLILQESDALENSEAPSSEFDHGAADVSLMNSELRDVKVSLINCELEDVKASLIDSEVKDVNVLLTNSELKDEKESEQSNGDSSCVDKSRLLKYTFQRKRKNSSRNPGQTDSLQEDAAKKRIVEKECIAQEPQMINESSRDSRRLAQVARQLISLSGKKWC